MNLNLLAAFLVFFFINTALSLPLESTGVTNQQTPVDSALKEKDGEAKLIEDLLNGDGVGKRTRVVDDEVDEDEEDEDEDEGVDEDEEVDEDEDEDVDEDEEVDEDEDEDVDEDEDEVTDEDEDEDEEVDDEDEEEEDEDESDEDEVEDEDEDEETEDEEDDDEEDDGPSKKIINIGGSSKPRSNLRVGQKVRSG